MYFIRLKTLREEHQFSKIDIAKKLSISLSEYDAFETGKKSMPTDKVIELAKLYQTSVDYIVGITDEKEPYDKRK